MNRPNTVTLAPQNTPKKMFGSVRYFSALFIITSTSYNCKSTSDNIRETDQVFAQKPTRTDVASRLTWLEKQNEELRKEVSIVNVNLENMNEKYRSMRRQMELLQRGLKSGLFDWDGKDLSLDSEHFQKENAEIQQKKGSTINRRTQFLDLPATASSSAPGLDSQVNLPSLGRAKAEWHKGDFTQTIVTLEETLKGTNGLAEQPVALLLLAEAYLKVGQANRSEEVVQRYLLNAPHHPEKAKALYILSLAQEQLGQSKKSKQTLREAQALDPKLIVGPERLEGP